MPARDLYHDVFCEALESDGWWITHDPLMLRYGGRELYVDLGAEPIVAAELDDQRIAIEIKSFAGPSIITDLERAFGQFLIYRDVLGELESDRTMFLAVPEDAVREIFDAPLGQLLIRNHDLKIVVFDPVKSRIVRWTA
jgi:hypothetical protein